ncbi:dihydrolipoamide acetyltransferase family protein [Streptomyces sp. b94]|uniref:dihydrolipoamide acetyltransferase family protein n=1 Tax=Streptomyces sp. b94 TaxID=1827634 RepID=UPI000BF0CA66|nr:dihydrolipoamide acetyltransferase family protein [Streptomyces sp. b94]
MAQVLEFKLPDLGEGLTEAEIVRWLVEVGDVVAIDQPVVEVETAKAMVEVPCPYGGVVTARFGEEGTELPVGAPLLTVAVGATESSSSLGTAADQAGPRASRNGGASADGSAAGAGPDSGTGPDSGSGSASGSGSGNVLVGYGTGAPAARRRRIRPQPTAINGTPAAASASASGSTAPGPVVAGPLTGSASATAGPVTGAAPATALAGEVDGREGPVAVVSPLVRRLARQHEIDLRRLTGSGPDGLILRADVDAAIRLAGEAAEAESRSADAPARRAVPERTAVGEAAAERVPLRGVRGAVADKLSRSRTEIPDATCWVDADATELMAVRAAMNAATGPSAGPKVSVLALLARICTAALARYPELNSTVDTEAREIVRLPGVHLGFAAQTERGLVVPVVRDAHTRNAESIGAEIARLTELARTGKLSPAQLTGGTFTLNNYGVFGVDGSTPIINHPEAAMLGVGRIMPKPWVHHGELAVRQVVQLSLTFDHRVCDGGTAGGFLRYVADCVEQPAVLLRTL